MGRTLSLHTPPPDFYLWNFLKDNVYQNNLQTIPELKRASTAKIQPEECVRVIDSFACRVQKCFQRHVGGGYLECIVETE